MSKQYTYEGAVYAFDKLVSDRWRATTWASSDAKAMSNLKHRFRKYAGLAYHTPITFAGKLIQMNA